MNSLELGDITLICISNTEHFLKNRMESSFFETFKQMEICARQFLLVQAVHEVVDFSQSEIADSFDFPDLLRALNEYTSKQEKREVDVSSNWRVISRFLEAAVEKLDGQKGDDSLKVATLGETRMFAEQFRRLLMIEFVGIWIKALEHERYHFSDLLKSLSEYARIQMTKHPQDTRPWGVWEVVAMQLETAAIEAQRQGDDLP